MLLKKYFRDFDWKSFAIILSICIIGLAFVFSSTYQQEKPFSIFFKKQALGILSGFVIYFICAAISSITFYRIGYTLNYLTIGLLIFTKLQGTIGMGAQRWISLIFFRFQPSELAKIFFPPFLVYYLTMHKEFPYTRLRDFVYPSIIAGITAVLILRQPDLGTALLYSFVAALLFWFAGLKLRVFVLSFLIIFASTPLIWKTLKPYQKERISVFLGYGDIKKERYQIEQAKIAIGSGGIFGKGYLKGTQNKYAFLPEGRTDFIFAVLCEEWGFLGAMLVIILYIMLITGCLLKIKNIENFSEQLLSLGLISYTLFAAIINIGMVIGLLPIVGIPLPFMSYGISNLWITLASFGILQGIFKRQPHKAHLSAKL